jgi:integrase
MSDLIEKHLTALRAEGRSPNTVIDRERLLRCLDRELPQGLDKALPDELREWLANDKWSPKTRETYWCHVVMFYRWCVTSKPVRLDYDPSEELRRPHVGRRLPRVASDAQLAQALATLARPALRVVILAAGLGMRASEAAAAEREHCTETRVLIRGKGDRMRAVPMQPDVWAEIGDCPPGRLVTDRGRAVDGHWVTRIVAAALDRVGLPTVTAHWFRGSYATRLRRAGADAFTIRELLGHADVGTTQKYMAIDDRDLADAVARLPPLAEPVRVGAPASH